MTQFNPGHWETQVDVRDFISRNYTPYDGDESFLAPPTERTKALWDKVAALLKEERDRGGVYDIDTETISGIDAYAPGYIDKDAEQVVGLQTSAPLTRAVMPFGGIRMVHGSSGGLQPPAVPGAGGDFPLPQDPQRRCVRRLHPGNARRPQ